MTVKEVGNILLYDPMKYDLYLKFFDVRDNTEYLSFEEFLLCENNLKEYIEDPDKIKNKYLEYHKDKPIMEYESYESYCKYLHVFPYDLAVIKDFKTCENCVYYQKFKNLMDDEEYLDCSIESPDIIGGYCYNHSFDKDKVEPIIRTLRR